MSGKSRRKRAQQKGKSRKTRHISPVTTTRSQTTPAAEPVTTPSVPAPAPQTEAATPALARNVYPHIVTELRTIGIMAGIMLAILVILAVALP
ncbi:MAG: hypothetical protein ABH839_03035 [Chloroflexota bacterium]